MSSQAQISEKTRWDLVSIVEKSANFLSGDSKEKSLPKVETKRIEIRQSYKVNVYDSSENNKYVNKTKNIVFIHGGAGQLTMWADQLGYFSKNYRVIAYDIMGHGGTDKLSAYTSMSQYAKDLEDLFKTLQVNSENTILIGYSLGANIAYKFAQENKVDRTVLIGMHLSKSYVHMSYRTLNLIASNILSKEWPEYRDKATTIGFLSAVLSYMNERDVGPQKGFAPVLIINGTKDKMTPIKEAKLLNQLIPNSNLMFFPLASHAVQTVSDFNKVVEDFINKDSKETEFTKIKKLSK